MCGMCVDLVEYDLFNAWSSEPAVTTWKIPPNPLPNGKAVESIDWLTDIYRFLATGFNEYHKVIQPNPGNE